MENAHTNKMKAPFVTIITVNYNGLYLLPDCLRSLSDLNYPADKLEIIVVDNNSNDGSVDFIKKNFPGVTVIINKINNYCMANNLGIKRSKGELVALINNDTEVDKQWLSRAVDKIMSDTSIGAVGSKILSTDGSLQSVGHQEYPDFYWGDIGFHARDQQDYNIDQEVISICGCSVLYRKKCLDDVGYLDEDFNMFLEDVDMGIRCTKKGWKLHTCSGSIIYHKLHGTIGNEENADYWKEANRLMLIAKHWPEELPDALMGRGFFSVQNSLDPGRDISSVLSRVYSKILKEHGRETLDKISPVLFSSVRKIYNFEKDLFLQKLANAQDDENRLNEELNTLREQKNELALLKQQREKEILEIIRQKDREISSILHQKDREIASILEDKQNQLDCLRQLKDREISSLIERKEAELSEATESWKKELDNVSLELQKKNNDLVNLYSSSGYRYILKPMWDFLWPIKQRLRKGKNNLRLSLIKIKSNYLITRDILKKIALTSSKLLGFWSAGLLSSRFKFIYLNHLKHNTMPVMPKRLILMINKKCNLQCSFCDIPKAKDREVDLDKSAAYKAIDAASRMGLTDLIITGGEPLLHPGLFEITEYAKSRNLKVTLTSNGILIRQNIERIIKAKFAYISISIDGNEPTHDNLRNKIGAYREAAEAIILLKKHGVDTFINFVITNKNISQLEEVYRHFQKQGVTVIFFPVINKPELSSLSREQKSAFLKFIKALRSEGGLSKQEYDYLKDSVLLYLEGKKVNTRCLGLNFEFAINNKGDISPCCLWDNKKEALNRLGNIFENDLEELWFSGEFHKARKSIFQEGCRQCFNPSLSEFSKLTGLSYFAHGIKKESQKASVSYPSKPDHIHFRFTSRCNLSCRHCDIWKERPEKAGLQELTFEEWRLCIDKLISWLGSFRLDIAGGEILLYKDALNVIHYCTKNGIKANLTTNATLIDEKMAKQLVNSGLYAINLSLDGFSDVHDYIRNHEGLFLKVKEAAGSLLKYRNGILPYISFSTVITRFNQEQLQEILELVDAWGMDGISFQALDHNFAADYNENWFKQNEFWPGDYNKIEHAINGLIKAKTQGAKICNSLEQLNDFKLYYCNPLGITKNTCRSGDANFIVDEYGGLRLCWNMPPVGNIIKECPRDLWDSRNAKINRNKIYHCNRTCRMLNCNYGK